MKSIIPISKFKSGETIQGFYLCVEKYLRHTRSGELYLDLVLKDKTGQINAKVFLLNLCSLRSTSKHLQASEELRILFRLGLI